MDTFQHICIENKRYGDEKKKQILYIYRYIQEHEYEYRNRVKSKSFIGLCNSCSFVKKKKKKKGHAMFLLERDPIGFYLVTLHSKLVTIIRRSLALANFQSIFNSRALAQFTLYLSSTRCLVLGCNPTCFVSTPQFCLY